MTTCDPPVSPLAERVRALQTLPCAARRLMRRFAFIRGAGTPPDQRFVLGLLHPVAGAAVMDLGFHYGERIVTPVTQHIVGALRLAAPSLTARDEDAPIGKGELLTDLVVGPARSLELGDHVLAARIRLIAHGGPPSRT